MVRFENCDKDHSSGDVRSVIKPFIQEGLFLIHKGVLISGGGMLL